jgi:hypothetical protein
MTETNKRPAHRITYGSVHLAIWKNENTKGTNYSVTMERRYLSAGSWNSTPGFFREDLLALGKALSEAHTWIYARSKDPVTPTEEAMA